MKKLEKAIDRIKILECPTGELEEGISTILEEYRVSNRDEITVNRDEKLDKDDLKAYRVDLLSPEKKSMIIFAKSGLDDYVAKVFEVNIY